MKMENCVLAGCSHLLLLLLTMLKDPCFHRVIGGSGRMMRLVLALMKS